jgi:PAS domain S-box-containing protein
MPKKPTYEELERRVKELEKVADERKRKSKAFLAADQKKEAILNSLMEHVIHQDTEMRILWANRAACESANLSYEEILGRYCYEIWPKRSDPCLDCPVIRAIETGQPQVIEKSTPDGRYWFIRGYPFRDINGDIVGGIEVTLEITEQKQAEEAIRESERRYSALVQESPDAIISLDEIGNLLSFNTAAERISGFSSEEVVGKHFAQIGVLAKQSIPKALKEFALVVKGADRPPFELTIINKDKSYFFMEANPRLIKQKGEKLWIQVTLRDITDRKLVEREKKKLEARLQQAHKMEAIGTLAGGIAHDFNNILGIILGNTELAMDDVPEWNPARFNLQEVRTASLRAKDVVHQLLSFARKTKLEKKPTDIIPIIKESLKLLRSSIPTSIELRQNITKNADTILADPTQINQVLINLCTNAHHAMPDGGILEVSLRNIELDEETATQCFDLNPGQYVNLTVSDTGHGIPQGDIDHDRIFDPYFTTKEVGKGTGMGLAVVHSIVKSHRGTISVESKLGKGTTFHIYFPVIEEEAVIETKTVEELPTGNERILFVDDEESIVYVGRTILERLGYQVETRMNPVEALELFRSQPDQFDLIITDMTMPKMTGYKLIREILNIRPDIPIILCTGFSEKIDEKKAKEIGSADYIIKPLDKRDLAIRVRQVLDGK